MKMITRLLAVFVVVMICSVSLSGCFFFLPALIGNSSKSDLTSSNINIDNSAQTDDSYQSDNSRTSVFDGDCGIAASAEIGNNIINYPELKITITNTSDKEIAAIKFYAVPFDVYGEEIVSWMTQKELYTDTAIPAGKTNTISYQLIEQSVKTVKLYVYSVYFTDGTEWGNRNAKSNEILSEAPTIEVTVVS